MIKQTETNGPGKYDWLATGVREQSQAGAVLVCIIGGALGDGFSVQATHPAYLEGLADRLEYVAAQIRAGGTTNRPPAEGEPAPEEKAA